MALVRGTLAAYASGTHTVSVRVDGSAPQVLENVPVAANIAAAVLTVGKRLLIETGPGDDPVVIAAW